MLYSIIYPQIFNNQTDGKRVSESPSGAVHSTRIDARGQCSFKTLDFTVSNPDAAGKAETQD